MMSDAMAATTSEKMAGTAINAARDPRAGANLRVARPARKKRREVLVSGTKHYDTNASMASGRIAGCVDSHTKPSCSCCTTTRRA